MFQNDYQYDEEFFNQLIIDVGEGNGKDFWVFLVDEFDNILGFIFKECEEVMVVILDKVQFKFLYFVKIVILFMKELFQ